jgi:hypothetical protein
MRFADEPMSPAAVFRAFFAEVLSHGTRSDLICQIILQVTDHLLGTGSLSTGSQFVHRVGKNTVGPWCAWSAAHRKHKGRSTLGIRSFP